MGMVLVAVVCVYLVEATIFCGNIQKPNEPRYIQHKYKSEGASLKKH